MEVISSASVSRWSQSFEGEGTLICIRNSHRCRIFRPLFPWPTISNWTALDFKTYRWIINSLVSSRRFFHSPSSQVPFSNKYIHENVGNRNKRRKKKNYKLRFNSLSFGLLPTKYSLLFRRFFFSTVDWSGIIEPEGEREGAKVGSFLRITPPVRRKEARRRG